MSKTCYSIYKTALRYFFVCAFDIVYLEKKVTMSRKKLHLSKPEKSCNPSNTSDETNILKLVSCPDFCTA